jgi:hypothetical protein
MILYLAFLKRVELLAVEIGTIGRKHVHQLMVLGSWNAYKSQV